MKKSQKKDKNQKKKKKMNLYLTVPQNFSNDFAKSTSLGSVSTCSFTSFEPEETSGTKKKNFF
jgi:hypothetical protein